MLKLADFPEVEEMHSVAGETGMILKVRTQGTHALEALLAQIYAVPGVAGTRSYIVLSTYLERPVQAELTQEWPFLHPDRRFSADARFREHLARIQPLLERAVSGVYEAVYAVGAV